MSYVPLLVLTVRASVAVLHEYSVDSSITPVAFWCFRISMRVWPLTHSKHLTSALPNKNVTQSKG